MKQLRDRRKARWCLSFYRYLTDLARPLLPQPLLVKRGFIGSIILT